MRLTILLGFALFASATSASAAPAVTSLCTTAKAPVEADPKLAAAVEAAFGAVAYDATAADCQYPLKLLRYASADVLLTQDGVPGQDCAQCGALLSAVVIQRLNGAMNPFARFREFAKLGAFGRVADIAPITIDGDDAFAAESERSVDGRRTTSLDFFAFHAGALTDLDPTPPVVIAVDGGKEAPSVKATWFFDPIDKTSLVVDYKIEAKGASRIERAVWRLQGGHLTLSRGKPPPETAR